MKLDRTHSPAFEPSTVRELSHHDEEWRSFDDYHALKFRMRHASRAIVCIVSRLALSELQGVSPGASNDELVEAFEAHVAHFEDIAEAKFAAADVVNGGIRINNSD